MSEFCFIGEVRVISAREARSGTNDFGSWVRQEFLIEYEAHGFTANLVVTAKHSEDCAKLAGGVGTNEKFLCQLTPISRPGREGTKYEDRFFTDVYISLS